MDSIADMLVMLDPSAAFDTVDHSILLPHLEHDVVIKGSAPRWIRSYLTNYNPFFSLVKNQHQRGPALYVSHRLIDLC